jgi:hypothetical protein
MHLSLIVIEFESLLIIAEFAVTMQARSEK